MRDKKPILLVDFDGTLTQYTGWKGARVADDRAVPGAIAFLIRALTVFDVCIYSARSIQWGGRAAMKFWIKTRFMAQASGPWADIDPAIKSWLAHHTTLSKPHSHTDELRLAATALVKSLRFPIFKPPAHLTIDDRAIRFKGTYPRIKNLINFKPWNTTNV